MSAKLSKLFLAFVKHEYQTYKTFIDNICFNRRKVRKKAIHMNGSLFSFFFFAPKVWAYWCISSGEDRKCIVSCRKQVTDNI